MAPPVVGPRTGPFDLELFGSLSYIPDFGTDGNNYRCFLLPLNNSTATYLTGFEALIDALPIVHHVQLEGMDAITKLMLLDPSGMAELGLSPSPLQQDLYKVFPGVMHDQWQQQGALAFMLAYYGLSCANTMSLNLNPAFDDAAIGRPVDPPSRGQAAFSRWCRRSRLIFWSGV